MKTQDLEPIREVEEVPADGNLRDLSLSVTFLFEVQVARSNASGILAELKPWHEKMCGKQRVSRVFREGHSAGPTSHCAAAGP